MAAAMLETLPETTPLFPRREERVRAHTEHRERRREAIDPRLDAVTHELRDAVAVVNPA